MLVEAASSVSRTKDTYLGAQYARIAARRDKKRAAVAVAHSMLVSAHHMLQQDEPYNDLGVTWHEQRHRDAHPTPGRPTATPRPHRHPRPRGVTTSEKVPSKHQRVRAPARTLSPAHAGVIHGSVNLAEDHLRRAGMRMGLSSGDADFSGAAGQEAGGFVSDAMAVLDHCWKFGHRRP
jgi:hypothetical protein